MKGYGEFQDVMDFPGRNSCCCKHSGVYSKNSDSIGRVVALDVSDDYMVSQNKSLLDTPTSGHNSQLQLLLDGRDVLRN